MGQALDCGRNVGPVHRPKDTVDEGEQFGAARAFGLGIVPWSPSQTVRSQENIRASEQAIPPSVGLNMRS
jgi:hypothetical protein